MEIKRLKGTDRTYEVIRQYSHRCGTEHGEAIMENWVECVSTNGAIAYWKACQLEKSIKK
jgi:hypothetical protein